MHHPLQYEMMAKIRQEEALRKAAALRAIQMAPAGRRRRGYHWGKIVAALATLALVLTRLIGSL